MIVYYLINRGGADSQSVLFLKSFVRESLILHIHHLDRRNANMSFQRNNIFEYVIGENE